MSERAQRHQRKLPPMPLSRTQEFWPTFRGAIDWMQKHQDTIETAMNLLEIYPKLIQHKSCDRLWNFVSKVAFFQKQELSSRNEKLERRSDHNSNKVSEIHEIPKIAVTETSDAESTTNKAHLVYVCCHFEDDSWQRLLQGLSEKFFVRCCKEKKLFDPEDCLKNVLMAGSFLFILDNKTVTDSYYLDQLHTALFWRIPVTFVRHPNFALPNPLPQSVFKILDRQSGNEVLADPLSRSSISGNQENKPSPCFKDEGAFSANYFKTDSDTNSVADLEHAVSLHSLSSSSVSSFGSTISVPLPAISPTQLPGSLLKKSCSYSADVSKHDELSKLKSFNPLSSESRLSTVPSVSFSDFLTCGYNEAVLYHSLYHNDCVERLAAMLKNETRSTDGSWRDLSNYSQSTQQRGLYSREDNSTEMHSDSNSHVIKENKQTINKIKRDSLDNERQSDNDLCSSVETIYAVFSDNKSSPELVHWPVPEHSEVTASPSLESFGFQDVDLSLNINMDLYSSDEG